MEPGHSKDNNLIHQEQSNYLISEDYFMAIAVLSKKRSKDPKTKVGACIVNKDSKIVGIGYNGMPKGCNEDKLPWGNDPNNLLNDKLTYVCHAETNAIVNKTSNNVKNCTLYVTLFPCNECAKIIIESGINKIVFMSERNQPKYKASRRMLEMAEIALKPFQATEENEEILINLKKIQKNKKIKK